MDQMKKGRLEECGINVEVALDRFMNNESMYEKFLLKFIADKNFDILRESIETGDVESAFDAAHTLKGVAANLELNSILAYLKPMVEILRKNEMTGVNALFNEMASEYLRVSTVIKTIAN